MAKLNIGDPAPPFNLPNIDGKKYSLDDFKDKKLLVIIFTCNHCPTAKAYEDRIIKIQNDYADKGVQIVAINPNDDKAYPEDSFEQMKIRAREKGFPFPYLRDEDQSVALAYMPLRTPDVYVFDESRRLRYRGAIDDNWKEPDKVTVNYLKEALDALLNGKDPNVKEVQAVGCTIKWKEEIWPKVQQQYKP